MPRVSSRGRRELLGTVGLLAAGAAVLAALTFRHAWALTHFPDQGRRTPNPAALGWREGARVLVHGAVLPRPRHRRLPSDEKLSHRAHWVTTSDGVRLEAWHTVAPQARGMVVLLHGYAAAKDSMLDQAREFRALGWSSYLVDFRGSGGSGGSETTIGVHEGRDVAAAWRAARALTPSGRPVVLSGASMGAAAALRAIAHEAVDPEGLILASPFDRLLTTVGHRCRPLGLPPFPAAHLLVFWGGLQHGFDGFAHNPVDYAAAVRCPTLLLHGETDDRARPEEARSVYDRLAGPKTFHLFPGVGHESLLARRPREWRAQVARFLDAVEQAVRRGRVS